MPEKTMAQAAEDIHNAELAIRELIARNYPTKADVATQFRDKEQEARARGAKRAALVVAGILAASVISFVGTVATVSGCFLTATPSGACTLLPGFDEAQDRNERLIEEFRRLGEITHRNDKRLDKLEQK